MTFRPLLPSDKELVQSLIDKDDFHKKLGITYEDVVAPGTDAMIIEDDDGTPLMVVRAHTAMRVAIQFNPDVPYRIAKNAHDVVRGLIKAAQVGGAKEIIIRPGGKAIRFTEKLGFIPFEGKFIEV